LSVPIGRISEICSGHQCYPPSIAISASSNVFAELLPVHRVGDSYIPHCCLSCHGITTARGSSSVYVNGRPSAHIGAMASCSSVMITGASTVWIEGS